MLQRMIAIALMAVGLGAGITSASTILPSDPGQPGRPAWDTPFDAGSARDLGQAG